MTLLLVNLQGTGVGYYRSWAPAKALEAAGHEVLYFPNTDNAVMDIQHRTNGGIEQWLMNVMAKVDAVHLGYTTSESILRLFASAREYARVALGRNVPLITDIDDDILHVPPANAGFSAYHGGSQERRIAKMQLQISDAVTVSTPPLAEALKALCKKVYVLPNLFTPEPWEKLPSDPKRYEDESIRLMFAGGRSRVVDLDTIREPLEQLMERYDGKNGRTLRLFFLGCFPEWATKWMPSPVDPLANRDFNLQNCILESYWATIKWFAPDIFVNPLDPTEFNKSKSHIKAYDAILGGSAYVGTDWPAHDEIPESAMSKCFSGTQWLETLSYLIENKEARAAKALALREWGLANRTIETHIQRWSDVYSECAKTPIVSTLEDTVSS